MLKNLKWIRHSISHTKIANVEGTVYRYVHWNIVVVSQQYFDQELNKQHVLKNNGKSFVCPDPACGCVLILTTFLLIDCDWEKFKLFPSLWIQSYHYLTQLKLTNQSIYPRIIYIFCWLTSWKSFILDNESLQSTVYRSVRDTILCLLAVK